MMNEDLINRIKEYLVTPPELELNLYGRPATDIEIEEAERELKVKFHEDFIDFI